MTEWRIYNDSLCNRVNMSSMAVLRPHKLLYSLRKPNWASWRSKGWQLLEFDNATKRTRLKAHCCKQHSPSSAIKCVTTFLTRIDKLKQEKWGSCAHTSVSLSQTRQALLVAVVITAASTEPNAPYKERTLLCIGSWTLVSDEKTCKAKQCRSTTRLSCCRLVTAI